MHTLHTKRFLLLLMTMALFASSQSCALCQFEDDGDLGFTSNVKSLRTGFLFQRSFGVQDEDASLIVNNTTLLYRKPRNWYQLCAFETRLTSALDRARQNRDADWRSLAILLESGATMYRKLNRNCDSMLLTSELVQLLQQKAPRSIDLYNAEVALAQVTTASHQYAQAESVLKDAAVLAQELFGSGSVQVAQVHSQLYFLYLDTGQTRLAIENRRAALKCTTVDVVAVEEQKGYSQSACSTPAILNSIDAVATNHELFKNEHDADEQALAALRRYKAGLDPEPDPYAPKPRKGDSEEEAPPRPYRLNPGLEGR